MRLFIVFKAIVAAFILFGCGTPIEKENAIAATNKADSNTIVNIPKPLPKKIPIVITIQILNVSGQVMGKNVFNGAYVTSDRDTGYIQVDIYAESMIYICDKYEEYKRSKNLNQSRSGS